jgi:hypothetical protein
MELTLLLQIGSLLTSSVPKAPLGIFSLSRILDILTSSTSVNHESNVGLQSWSYTWLYL